MTKEELQDKIGLLLGLVPLLEEAEKIALEVADHIAEENRFNPNANLFDNLACDLRGVERDIKELSARVGLPITKEGA